MLSLFHHVFSSYSRGCSLQDSICNLLIKYIIADHSKNNRKWKLDDQLKVRWVLYYVHKAFYQNGIKRTESSISRLP